MEPATISAFLSSSFAEKDKRIYELVAAIAAGLRIDCSNVDQAFTTVPPNVAQAKIGESDLLIGIISKRDETVDGRTHMPAAVRDEIACAFALKKKLILIAEEGVSLNEGFINTYASWLPYELDKIYEGEFIEKLVSSIHRARTEILASLHHGATESVVDEAFYAERIKAMIELREVGGDYVWDYSFTKRLRFNRLYDQEIRTGAWATSKVKIPNDAENLKLEVTIDDSTSATNFEVQHDIIHQAPDAVVGRLRFEPQPTKGDEIEYTTYTESKYLNPIYAEDLPNAATLSVNGRSFSHWDGVVITSITKSAHIRFRIPRSTGLVLSDFEFIVGRYANSITYVTESEIERANLTADTIGRVVEIGIEIESPLLGHFYGVAWNPRSRPSENP